MLKMNAPVKPARDIMTYVKGFHIEANLSGLRMPILYSKLSATGELGPIMSLDDKDTYDTSVQIVTKLLGYFAKFKGSSSKKFKSVSRSEFQKMFAMDLLALCSRKQYDQMSVEAIEFFTQLFLNSYVESNLINKEVTKFNTGTERHHRVVYTAK
jgi:hypothetical protein